MNSKLFYAFLAGAWLMIWPHDAKAQFEALYSFTDGVDGADPNAGLIFDPTGTILYGTTSQGGANGEGAVFAYDTTAPPGTGLTTLYSFSTVQDGADPVAGVVLSIDGQTLYGTTTFGGIQDAGVVFSVQTDGSTVPPLSPLYTLTGGSDGGSPNGGVILDPTGAILYGTTARGGIAAQPAGYGTIFSFNIGTGVFTTLYTFTGGNDGAEPLGALVLSGNTLYGTTLNGGNSGGGTVFAVKTDGSTAAPLTPLYAFTYGSDGGGPLAGLILDPTGTILYGTTADSSTVPGTIFAVKTDGSTVAPLRPLHSFNGGSDGAFPHSGLILDATGTILFGTAAYGGSAYEYAGYGTVFALNTNGAGFTTLYTFTDGSDGAEPDAGLMLASTDDTLYGMASAGGSSSNGTVFSFSLAPEVAPSFSDLSSHDIVAGSTVTLSGNLSYGGAVPVYPPQGDPIAVTIDGNTQTATLTDSTGDFSLSYNASIIPLSGTPYTITYSYGGDVLLLPASDTSTTLKVNQCAPTSTLYALTGLSDGANPPAGVVLSGGKLYGTSFNGGVVLSNGAVGGALFSLNTDGTDITPLHDFTGQSDVGTGSLSDGAQPEGGVIFSSDGKTLYGTTSEGGTEGGGTIFSFNIETLFYTNLYDFLGPTDAGGYSPLAGLILSGDGQTLYGTTVYGGHPSGEGYGTVFSFNIGTKVYTPLYAFMGGSDGGYPLAGVVLSADGQTLYGTAYVGGSQSGYSGHGTVFAVKTDGSTTAPLTPLYTFTGGSDGDQPYAGLVLSGDGKTLYGTTYFGGINAGYFGYGTLFAVQTDGSTEAQAPLNPVHAFTGGDDGGYPNSALILDPTGTILYGTTTIGGISVGSVFASGTNGLGFTTLYDFQFSSCDGEYPQGALFLSGNTLYGTTYDGGAGDDGTVFSVSLPPPCAPPVANLSVLAASADQSVSVPVAVVLRGDSAPGGGTLSIRSVVSPTGEAASVTLAGGDITYVPAPGFAGSDTIQYNLSDACATVSGFIAITVAASGSEPAAAVTTPAGQIGSVAVPPTASHGGVTATLNNVPGTQSATMTAKLYSSDPMPGSSGFGLGTTYLDLQVSGATAGDTVTAYFYSPRIVPVPVLMYYTGSAWEDVVSDVPPPEIPAAILQDGLWQYAVVFDDASTPAISELTGTVFALAASAGTTLVVTHSGNSVIISWPDAGNYVLQQNGNLATTNWTASGYAITTASGTNSITITPPLGTLFFRLANP